MPALHPADSQGSEAETPIAVVHVKFAYQPTSALDTYLIVKFADDCPAQMQEQQVVPGTGRCGPLIPVRRPNGLGGPT